MIKDEKSLSLFVNQLLRLKHSPHINLRNVISADTAGVEISKLLSGANVCDVGYVEFHHHKLMNDSCGGLPVPPQGDRAGAGR